MTTSTANTILSEWNGLGLDDAAEVILPCNGSPVWATLVAYNRPFDSPASLFAVSDEIWMSLPEEDWQEAFDSHPRLGERKAKAATEKSLSWSTQEQSAADPDDAVRQALADGNREYEAKFGRIFLLCATGRSAEEMLTILRQRLQNDAETELREAAEQQRLITRLRLRKWLEMPGLTCAELAESAADRFETPGEAA
ncbi:MAG TPA: 2-oxo-4-hydroxy-4-carboxy-5-ureidoimidazoline decarboxylase [Acidobacteriaceae bacterium]|nr:2-oxo-4-hydroxy-4-carboxy-5-ureidoimidazoline decarboxylase [Acidobacteriaceae bacterium]